MEKCTAAPQPPMRTDAHGPPRPSPHALGPTCCAGDAVRVRIGANAKAVAHAPSGHSATIVGANVAGSGSQPLPALSRKILGHPSKKRPHQGFSRGKFVDSADRFYQRGGRSPLCCGRPVKHNDRSWGGCGADPLYVRQPRHPPLGSKNAFRTDASAETRLVHAMCTPKARRESRRRKAAFSTKCRGGSDAHLQGL